MPYTVFADLAALLSPQASANGNHMKETQVRSHSKMFLDVWEEYNNSQLEFRDKRRKQERCEK